VINLAAAGGSSAGSALLVLQAALKAWKHRRTGDNVCIVIVHLVWDTHASRAVSRDSWCAHVGRKSIARISSGIPAFATSTTLDSDSLCGQSTERSSLLDAAAQAGRRSMQRDTYCGKKASDATLTPDELRHLQAVLQPDMLLSVSNLPNILRRNSEPRPFSALDQGPGRLTLQGLRRKSITSPRLTLRDSVLDRPPSMFSVSSGLLEAIARETNAGDGSRDGNLAKLSHGLRHALDDQERRPRWSAAATANSMGPQSGLPSLREAGPGGR